MALSNDIRTLRDRVLADLSSAHDYYMDTNVAWRLVQDAIAAGRTMTIRNTTTGTVTTQAELAAKAGSQRPRSPVAAVRKVSTPDSHGSVLLGVPVR